MTVAGCHFGVVRLDTPGLNEDVDVTCAPNAKLVWDTMFSLYGQESNLGRIFELKKQIASIKEGKSLPQYFGEFTDLWNELMTL